VEGILHVPGLRANPSRTYQTSAVGRSFPGTFDNYVASVINSWQENNDPRLGQLGDVLRSLGLTWKVRARPVDATRVEIQVGRLLHGKRGGAQDLVNIADVGFGVSQVLPVVVALLAAHPGQLVYMEQPETHLHPRAEAALAGVLCDAAKRGVLIVAETHSPLLLTALQTQVAAGHLDPELVKLHWFMRRSDGVTEIASADLDANGAYGPWPEDFGEVTLKTEGAYLDAVEGVSAR
jgi:predicted ATPase